MNFDEMNIKDLRTYAKTNGIKLQSAVKKSEILAIVKDNAVEDPETLYDLLSEEEDLFAQKYPGSETEQSVVTSPNENARKAKEDAIIAERVMNTDIEDRKPTGKDMAVCVYSEKKYSSSSLGRLDIGYNIVKEELAKIWVRLPDVRAASPEELMRAKANGIKPGERVGAKGRRM